MKQVFIDNKDENFKAVMQIRNAVFKAEQGAIASEELDFYDSDSSTIYLLLYDEGEPCATGRIAITPNGVKIGRIAVTKAQRGKGTGRLLVQALCDKVREVGAERIFVDSQLHAVEFYKKLGFAPTGEAEIIDRGIRHLPMVRDYE